MDPGRAVPGRVRKKRAATSRKSLVCEYCSRPFARLEHLQRHLRTHTKEKPFACEICSKSFARSDLLVRHDRLVHPSDNANKAERRASSSSITQAPASDTSPVLPPPSTPSRHHDPQMLDSAERIAVQQPPLPQPQAPPVPSPQIVEPAQFSPSWGYHHLNLLSHAASHVALEGQQEAESIGQSRKVPSTHDRPIADNYGVEPSILDLADLGDPVQDFTTFLESVGLSSDWDSGMFTSVETDPILQPPPMPFDSKQPAGATSVMPSSSRHNNHNGSGELVPDTRGQTEEAPSFSNFGSRLPSLQPETHDQEEQIAPADDGSQSRPAWDVSNQDRQLFLTRLDDFASVLPKGFVPPSRHALSRFLAGYVNGLNEHLPFIHVPTLSVSRCSPELTLALAAAGSHYRFENNRGIELFHAAKAVLLERIRRREAGRASQHSWNISQSVSLMQPPRAPFNSSSSPFQQPYLSPCDNATYPGEDSEAQMEVIRTFLLLTVFASWERHPDLLREMLALQSTLARLVRDHGLSEQAVLGEYPTWEDWIRQEADRRTKLVVYCFFNLHSIMYNIPPLILNSEIKLNMPAPADEWKATSALQWRRLNRPRVGTELSFQEAFGRLFTKSAQINSSSYISPLGNYVLIHAIIQQIFFARQLCLSAPQLSGSSLRPDDLAVLDGSLSAWKAGWRSTPESSIDPQSPAGPIAFTSTALLGLAYIRLHVDLGPWRRLVTQDPMQIAQALRDSPPLIRSPRLIMALLHSAHALSIPVRLGIDFVARTHSFFWSIQHSLCSLECAFLLSRWLLSIPGTRNEQKLSEHERKLILWVKSMIDETDMSVGMMPGSELDFLNDPIKVKQLSIAVVRVWSKTFKGNTSWPIVDLIGSSLEIYADFLEA